MKDTNKLLLFATILTFASGALAGCGATGGSGTAGTTDTSTPSFTSGISLPSGTNALLSVHVTGTSPASALTLDVGGRTLELTTALMGLSEVKLRTASTTDSEAAEIELQGPFIVNLDTQTVENLGSSHIDDDADDDGVKDSADTDDDDDGVVDASDSDDDNDGVADAEDHVMGETEVFDSLDLPAGTYTKIEAKLDKIEEGDGIDPANPLVGKSLLIEGTFDGQAFRVTADFDEEFEVENPDGIAVSDTSIASFILTFDIAQWFNGINLSTAEIGGDGVVLLDSGNNASLFEQFHDNVKATMDLKDDSNDDGTPDDEE